MPEETATQVKLMVGRRIRITRTAIGMRRKDFLREMDISTNQLSNWETGVYWPDTLFLVRWHERHGVSADWILFGRMGSLPRDLASKISDKFNRK